MTLALADGIITRSSTVFDYGCGRGCDLELLEAQGFACSGWDPAFRPDAARTPVDVVNLGFDEGCKRAMLGGSVMARFQDGRVQNYLRVIGVALTALVLLLIWGCRAS